MINLDDYVMMEQGIHLIPDDGVGVEFEVEGVHYRVLADKAPRQVSLDVTSYIGSIGATHYYGDLRVNDLPLMILMGDKFHKDGAIINIMYKSIDEARPRFTNYFTIELHRQIDAPEIAEGSRYNPDRWQYYEVGDWTNGFNSRAEVITRAREVFHALFAHDWRLVSRMQRLGTEDGFEQEGS